jgi:hypothetical protein
MNRKFLAPSVVCLVVCLFPAGCSRSGRPTVAPVRGQVTYQAKPLAGATVAFLCPGAPRLAVGTTDDAGNYRLTTFEPYDGAIIGTHVVTVNVFASEPEVVVLGPDPPAGAKAMSNSIDDAMKRSVRQIQKADKAKPPIPLNYTERRTSNLRKEVGTGDNVINIELKD